MFQASFVIELEISAYVPNLIGTSLDFLSLCKVGLFVNLVSLIGSPNKWMQLESFSTQFTAQEKEKYM
jgi:hypothetical protein